jgi:predicted N-formylglutamate amidohydrolase
VPSTPAFETFNPQGDPRIVLVCDHASNFIPPEYQDLGLPAVRLKTHIAWDIGAAAVTRTMAAVLGAPAILGTHSRLLIDLNRGEDDPTLVMKLSDGAIIPGNATAGEAEIHNRTRRFYQPYHEAIAGLIAGARQKGVTPVIVSIHSFTPEWKGKPRPWHVGVLWSRRDDRLSSRLLAILRAEAGLCVGDNQPYSGELEGDCMDRHALATGLPHVLIELRQDLIGDADGAKAWGTRLVPLLQKAIAGMNGA